MIAMTVYCPRCNQPFGAIPQVSGVDLVYDELQADSGETIRVNHRAVVRFDAADIYHRCPAPGQDTHEAFPGEVDLDDPQAIKEKYGGW